MTTQEKCEAILKEILRRCNDVDEAVPRMSPEIVGFAGDWGGNSLTLFMDGSHTHVGGHPDATWDDLIDSLYERLVNDRGLSLAIPLPLP